QPRRIRLHPRRVPTAGRGVRGQALAKLFPLPAPEASVGRVGIVVAEALRGVVRRRRLGDEGAGRREGEAETAAERAHGREAYHRIARGDDAKMRPWKAKPPARSRASRSWSWAPSSRAPIARASSRSSAPTWSRSNPPATGIPCASGACCTRAT